MYILNKGQLSSAGWLTSSQIAVFKKITQLSCTKLEVLYGQKQQIQFVPEK